MIESANIKTVPKTNTSYPTRGWGEPTNDCEMTWGIR